MDAIAWEGITLAAPGAAIIGKSAVVADLHFGFEHCSTDILRVQTRLTFTALQKLIECYNIEEIIINGDVKHSFGKEVPGEWAEIRLFFNRLKDLIQVRAVKGNHDNYLQNILMPLGIKVEREVELEGWLITHGHELSPTCERKEIKGVVIGHEHPAVKFRDDVGATFKYRCFLLAQREGKPLLVLPSLNPWSFGTDILESKTYISPFLNAQVVSKAKIVVVEGDQLFSFGSFELLRAFR